MSVERSSGRDEKWRGHNISEGENEHFETNLKASSFHCWSSTLRWIPFGFARSGRTDPAPPQLRMQAGRQRNEKERSDHA